MRSKNYSGCSPAKGGARRSGSRLGWEWFESFHPDLTALFIRDLQYIDVLKIQLPF